jgi:hypothetical protein
VESLGLTRARHHLAEERRSWQGRRKAEHAQHVADAEKLVWWWETQGPFSGRMP